MLNPALLKYKVDNISFEKLHLTLPVLFISYMKLVIDITESEVSSFVHLMQTNGFGSIARQINDLENQEKADSKKKIRANQLIKKVDLENTSVSINLAHYKTEFNKRGATEKRERFKAFQELLLSGPVMDEEQYEVYKQVRKRINKWRQK